MTVQATVGSTVLASAVGVGTAAGGTTTGSVIVAQSAQTLAFTGASHTMLLVAVAILMIVAGVLLNGLSKRHGGLATAAMHGTGPPMRL
jgi:hypothetical protein